MKETWGIEKHQIVLRDLLYMRIKIHISIIGRNDTVTFYINNTSYRDITALKNKTTLTFLQMAV